MYDDDFDYIYDQSIDYEDDEYDYDEYYEPEEPPTRWQRFKSWLVALRWKIGWSLPKDMDDIPF
jgi:hypothetical protein